jgi:hypothetical protein
MEQETKLQKPKSPLKLVAIVLGIAVILVGGVLLWRFGGNLTGKTGQKLVSGFPTSPVYPNAELKSSQKTLHHSTEDNTEDFTYHGTWETTDSVPTVMDWYLKKLPQDGWLIDDYPANKKEENIQFIDAHKGNQTIQVSVIRDKGTQMTKVILEYPYEIPEDES